MLGVGKCVVYSSLSMQCSAPIARPRCALGLVVEFVKIFTFLEDLLICDNCNVNGFL